MAPPFTRTSFPCRAGTGRAGRIGEFGAPRSGGRTHEGFDIVAACGTPLVAAATGRVLRCRLRPGSLRQLPADPRPGRAPRLLLRPPGQPRRACTAATASGPGSGSGSSARPAMPAASVATSTSRSTTAAARSTRRRPCAVGRTTAELSAGSAEPPWLCRVVTMLAPNWSRLRAARAERSVRIARLDGGRRVRARLECAGAARRGSSAASVTPECRCRQAPRSRAIAALASSRARPTPCRARPRPRRGRSSARSPSSVERVEVPVEAGVAEQLGRRAGRRAASRPRWGRGSGRRRRGCAPRRRRRPRRSAGRRRSAAAAGRAARSRSARRGPRGIAEHGSGARNASPAGRDRARAEVNDGSDRAGLRPPLSFGTRRR